MRKLSTKSKSLALAGLISVATLVLGPARLVSAQAVGGSWSYTGNLNTARNGHTATLLPGGKVLVTGGNYGSGLFTGDLTAELYDPATGSWSSTGSATWNRSAGGAPAGSFNNTATLLPSGKVLVAGGSLGDGSFNTAELYDPATGTWSITGSLNTARESHTATLLPNGKVLVAGGFDYDYASLNSAELYDPATGTWSSTGSLHTARAYDTATLLPNGKVLVEGGFDGVGYYGGGFHLNEVLNSAELYDPATGTWSSTGNLNTARKGHTATLLPSGQVLVAGGYDNYSAPNSAELYDPATGTWSSTGNLNTARNGRTATLLPSGQVLVAGGDNNGNSELYDPATGTWSNTANPNTARSAYTATLLPNGKVLVAGGSRDNTAELYDPGASSSFEPVALGAGAVTLKTWTLAGRTSAYLRLTFPDAGFRIADFGSPVQFGSDFSADARVEHFTGAYVQAVKTTAQIYDLGALAPGNYTFTFKNSGTAVKSIAFTVSSGPPAPNSIDDQRQFVREQYRDFLNREADQAGEDFWTDNITLCSDPARRPAGQTEAQCTTRQRETTSGAFFLSPEFQYTGYYVYRMYQGALGRQPKLSEFTPDAQFVGAGILVNGQLSGAKINQNKADFAQQFVNCTDAAKYRCAEFKTIYVWLNNQQYVDKLFQTTGVNASTSDRTALVNGLNSGTETRASVLQKVVDGTVVLSEGNQQFTTSYGQAFYNSEFNRAFVQLEYFGYMKRDPDDGGYAFWLGKLNQFGGNFVNAEMVLAFISSPEYRARFGQP